MLTGFFIEKIKRRLGFDQLTIEAEVIAQFSQYSWPGNVRELEHMLSRAALKASANENNPNKSTMKNHHHSMVTIQIIDCDSLNLSRPDHLQTQPTSTLPQSTNINFKSAVENYQKSLILNALHSENGNWSATAKKLQMDRANLSRLAKRLGIKVQRSVALLS